MKIINGLDLTGTDSWDNSKTAISFIFLAAQNNMVHKRHMFEIACTDTTGGDSGDHYTLRVETMRENLTTIHANLRLREINDYATTGGDNIADFIAGAAPADKHAMIVPHGGNLCDIVLCKWLRIRLYRSSGTGLYTGGSVTVRYLPEIGVTQ